MPVKNTTDRARQQQSPKTPYSKAEKTAADLVAFDKAVADAERAHQQASKIEDLRDAYESTLDANDDARTDLANRMADATVSHALGEITAEELAALGAAHAKAEADYVSGLAARDAADRRLKQAERDAAAADVALQHAVGALARPLYDQLSEQATAAYAHFAALQRRFLEVGYTGGHPVEGDCFVNHGERDTGPEGSHLSAVAKRAGIDRASNRATGSLERIPLDQLRAMAVAFTTADPSSETKCK